VLPSGVQVSMAQEDMGWKKSAINQGHHEANKTKPTNARYGYNIPTASKLSY